VFSASVNKHWKFTAFLCYRIYDGRLCIQGCPHAKIDFGSPKYILDYKLIGRSDVGRPRKRWNRSQGLCLESDNDDDDDDEAH
jgi:hypothetical protein